MSAHLQAIDQPSDENLVTAEMGRVTWHLPECAQAREHAAVASIAG
jgi:hypothetical protein